ncbi:hypothetical protein cypCar_00030111 [Cyprinus carpio]|nr:hypothetical protein cypCar_00030111 [Cyprinus carpio]
MMLILYCVFQMRNRQRGSDLGLLLLAGQVFQLGIDNIPPVTLATLGLNVYLFLFPAKPLLQTCLSVQEAFWYRDWRRLLLSPFHHVDDMHLYFNMASLLWKGINLERKLGGAWFAYLLSVFSVLTGLVYLLLETGLTHMTEDSTSFVGHLAGILVGLLYTTGPLKRLMKTCAGFVTSNGHYGRQQTYFNSSGYSGYGMPSNPQYGQQSFIRRQYGAPYREPYDTAMPSAPSQHPYTAGLSEEEQYAAAVRASLNDRG